MANQHPLIGVLFPGLVKLLSVQKGFKLSAFACQSPASVKVMDAWERDNNVKLPEDLRLIYMQTNGFHLNWSIALNGPERSIGTLRLNTIQNLTKSNISSASICFNLEPNILLVYHSATSIPEIKFFDPESQLKAFKICDSYSNYHRLSASFYGVIGWQLGYSFEGWPPQTHDWICYLDPKRAQLMRSRASQVKYSYLISPAQIEPPKNADAAAIVMRKKEMWAAGIPSDLFNWWLDNKVEGAETGALAGGVQVGKLFSLDVTMESINSLLNEVKIAKKQRPSTASSSRKSTITRCL